MSLVVVVVVVVMVVVSEWVTTVGEMMRNLDVFAVQAAKAK